VFWGGNSGRRDVEISREGETLQEKFAENSAKENIVGGRDT